MITIVDYGMGNSRSIQNMIRKVGGEAEITGSPSDIEKAKILILPGVGAFDNAIEKLHYKGIYGVLKNKVEVEKTPFLGVCLGMQLLFDSSEEGEQEGFGLIPGSVKKFDFSGISRQAKLKIPHMGWNTVKPVTYDSLYLGLEAEARFYFVHSYHVVCSDESTILATSHYGYDFVCSVHKENIWGAQFHPEKSHRYGISFFRNFLSEIQC